VHLALFVAILGTGQGPIVDAGIFAGTPSILSTGQLVGPSVDAWFSTDVLRFGARGRVGLVGEDDQTFHIAHTELRAAALAALVHALGRGEVSVQLGLGGVALYEVRTRHQAERLTGSGIEAETRAWSLGPQASLEGALRLNVFEGFGVAVDGGPIVGRVGSALGTPIRVGLSASLSVSYAF
jgi:hypothetical protein